MIHQPPNTVLADDGLDSRLLLLGLWRRRHFLATAVVLSLVVGALLGSTLGKKTYAAVSSVAFDTVAYEKAYNRQAPQPTELVGLAKSPANLDSTRHLLDLQTNRDQLDAAVDVSYDRDTNLIRFETDWPTAPLARDITNTLRDVFLTTTRDHLLAQTRNDIQNLRDKLAQANHRVDSATRGLQAFLVQNGVSVADLTGHPSGTEDLFELSYSEAQAERSSVKRELDSVNQAIALLASRVPQEEAAARKNAMISQAAARSQALLAIVEQQRSQDTNRADLIQSSNELARAQSARNEGLISQQDYERAETAHAKALAMSHDNGQYQQWKTVANDLAQPIDATALVATSASAGQLEQLRLQAEGLQRQVSMATTRADELRHQYEKMRRQDSQYPLLMQQYDKLNHYVQQAQNDRNEADTNLARANDVLQHDKAALAGISVLAPATLPHQPLKSGTRLITLGVTGLGILLSFAWVVGGEMLDKRQKAPVELQARLAMPVLGTLPKLAASAEQPDLSVLADFKRMARRLRQHVPGHGARVLLLSPRYGEGTAFVTQGLMRALAGDDIVLLEGAPLEDAVQSEEQARGVDALVLVVRNHTHAFATLRDALRQLAVYNVPVVGAVVTEVDPLYLVDELRGEETLVS